MTPPLAGFTLIEVVLVSVVIGLLLTASIPRFHQTAQRLRLEQSAFGVSQLLRFAHELAVVEGHEVMWAWNAEERRPQVFAPAAEADDDQPEWLERNPTTHPSVGEGVEVTLEGTRGSLGCPMALGIDGECVRFFPDGTSEATTMQFRLGDDAYRVTVDGATSQVLLTAGSAPR